MSKENGDKRKLTSSQKASIVGKLLARKKESLRKIAASDCSGFYRACSTRCLMTKTLNPTALWEKAISVSISHSHPKAISMALLFALSILSQSGTSSATAVMIFFNRGEAKIMNFNFKAALILPLIVFKELFVSKSGKK